MPDLVQESADQPRQLLGLLDALGIGYAVPGRGGGCCGALHTHAGLHADAVRLAERVMQSMPGDAPVLVNSAGCGAALKDYGRLLGTDVAQAFSARVFDIHEWVAARLDELPPLRPRDRPVIVQDPCHLRHVQRAHEPVRAVLAPFVREVAELDDEGLCCGAGGAYALLQPRFAGAIRDRKTDAIARGRTAVVEQLLVHGADPNSVNQTQTSALALAEGAGHAEIVALLRRYGAR